MSAPSLSVIVNFFNSRREAARTLLSLSATYQNQVDPSEYEVIAVDNGSSAPLTDELVRCHGPNFRYVFHATTSKSPVEAINRAVAGCAGRNVMILIDGAHIVSPGVIRSAHAAFRSFASPFVVTVPFHIGPEMQNMSIMKGYNQEVEDKLLASIDWASNGYRLFDIAGACADASMGWFGRLYESGCFAISKVNFLQLGGFDERFQARGGGLANLDFFARALLRQDLEYVLLLGEGSFHQFHGGVASNAPANAHPWHELHEEYVRIRGQPFKEVDRRPTFLGQISPEATRWAALSATAGFRWWQQRERNVFSNSSNSMTPRRNDACVCGSGRKHKHCCGAHNSANQAAGASGLSRSS